MGFTGTLNISTTVVAQQIAELPLYSGLGYQAFFVLCLLHNN